MTNCDHCGTAFSPRTVAERFCCRGCEYVYELIGENGFDQFYDLKRGLAVTPVRSRPFEEHDFSWLPAQVAEAETQATKHGGSAHLDLSLEGISCVGCVWLIEKLFIRGAGAIRAAAHPSSGRLHLEWQPGGCDLEAFMRELCKFGYVAGPAGANHGDGERRRLSARVGLCGAFAMNTMGFTLPWYLGMPADFEFAGLFRIIAFLSATLSMLVGAEYFISRAWRALRVKSLHIDLPIALGLIAAYLGSILGWMLGAEKLMYFDFVSTFVFLMLAGRLLQTSAVERNRKRLMRQQPVPPTLEAADGGAAIKLDDLKADTRFLLQAGRAVPVASTLGAGEADFSLEWIRGESEAVRFHAGSRLPAGAILLSRNPVELVAGEAWKESLLARLTAPMTGDRGNPGLEKLLRGYLLVVLLIGVATLAYWLSEGKMVTGMQAMISVFVISCPCALGVAIPLADDLAASRVERAGAFVRTATIWPRLRRVKKVIFDKTGTLTLERPLLDHPERVAELDGEAALALAVLTQGSLHPLARVLLETLGTRGQRLLRDQSAASVEEFPGLGVKWNDGGVGWSLGRIGWQGPAGGSAESGSDLCRDGRLVSRFSFHESLRPGAMESVRRLKDRGLSLHILSGDHPDKVAVLAAALEIPQDQAKGGLSPEDKARAVKELDQKDTLYIGDGANDSLAFDAALVTGTPVVDRSLLESKSDFYTLGSGLDFLDSLLDAAASRANGVRMGFAFALIYNAVTVLASMSGSMSPLLAAILMPLSSLVSITIVASHLRLRVT
jgi:Cu2+-exporting ATPase